MNPISKVVVWESEPIVLREQVYMRSGSLMLSTDASAISVSVYDAAAVGSESTALYSTSPAVSPTIHPASLTDWTRDDVGSNLSLTLATGTFTKQGGHVYNVEAAISTTADDVKVVVWQVRVEPMLSA